MNLFLTRSNRFANLAMALAASGALIGLAAAPAPAHAATPYYIAKLAAPSTEEKAVAGGVAWACEQETCVAVKGQRRPVRICRMLVREMGKVASFTAGGEALTPEKLAKCNGE